MGVMLPPELSGFLGMIGVPWPNIDEDEIRKDATAWRTVQAGSEPAAAQADQSVRRTRLVYQGDSADAMATHWNRVGGDGGHVSQATSASRMAPVALDGTANVVSAVKVAVGTQAAAGLVSVVKLLAFGGAVGATAATARMLLVRNAAGRAMREGAEGTGKVLAPALGRRVTEPMRRILDNLRGSRLATGGARGGIPPRLGGARPPSGPRSVEDGIARMARGKKRGGGGRGNHWDQSGKVHGSLPSGSTIDNMTDEAAKKLRAELKESLLVRKSERLRFGDRADAGHGARIRQEEEALDKINKKLDGK